MNIHHRHMQQITQHMQAWTQTHLAHLGIYECNYSSLNMQNAQWIGLPMNYRWYCAYLEQGLDASLVDRLKRGTHYWNPKELLYKKYQYFAQSLGIKNPHRLDFTIATPCGFEMLTLSCDHTLRAAEYVYILQAFNSLSATARHLAAQHPQISLEFAYADAFQRPQQPLLQTSASGSRAQPHSPYHHSATIPQLNRRH